MPCDYSKYPPNWKTEIVPAIRKRSGNRCERCGIKNYSVGSRNEDGEFEPTGGNIQHDKAGNGELNYKEAMELVKHCNEWAEEKLIVIVLTVAHLDHDAENHEIDLNRLAHLCQRCHNRHDIAFRKNNRIKNKGQQTLFP